MALTGLTGVRNRIRPPKIGAGVKGMYGDVDKVAPSGAGMNPLSGTPATTAPPQFGSQFAPKVAPTQVGSAIGSMKQHKFK